MGERVLGSWESSSTRWGAAGVGEGGAAVQGPPPWRVCPPRRRGPAALGELVEAVEAPQERALAAPRGADDRRDGVGREKQRDLTYGDLAAEQRGQLLGREPDHRVRSRHSVGASPSGRRWRGRG